jgi:hypothetical protein
MNDGVPIGVGSGCGGGIRLLASLDELQEWFVTLPPTFPSPSASDEHCAFRRST